MLSLNLLRKVQKSSHNKMWRQKTLHTVMKVKNFIFLSLGEPSCLNQCTQMHMETLAWVSKFCTQGYTFPVECKHGVVDSCLKTSLIVFYLVRDFLIFSNPSQTVPLFIFFLSGWGCTEQLACEISSFCGISLHNSGRFLLYISSKLYLKYFIKLFL